MERITQQNTTEKSVLIIGAGRTGLITARHLLTVPNCSITIVEAKSDIGGLWAYEELNEHHPKAEEAKRSDNYHRLYHCFQGSIYPDVILNIPIQLVSCKDFTVKDFDPKLPDFLMLKQYNSYINAYCDHFGLRKYVTYNTLVKLVRPYENLSAEEKSAIKDLPPRTWVVTTVDAKAESLSQNEKVATFDYVVAASGLNVKPHIPPVNGISNFKGFVLHSKDFREPEDPIYRDKTILLLGGSYSGIDMVVQFFHNPIKGRQKIKKMIFCAKDVGIVENSTDFKDLREEGVLETKKGWVSDFTEDSVIFTDGTSEKVDVVMFCTGYMPACPYLDPGDKIIDFGGEGSRDKYIGPLYKRVVSIRQPRLLFAGTIDFTPIGHYLNEAQIIFIKHIIEGSVKLPTVEEMTNEHEKDIEAVKANSKDGSLANYFRLEILKTDLPYLESLQRMCQHLYPGGEEKAKKYVDSLVAMTKTALDLFMNGNLLQYKSLDFSSMFPEEVRNTTEFY